ncbi:MAG: gliding motility-associated C-terminal domain-containing protein [Bacteroidota bacterium]
MRKICTVLFSLLFIAFGAMGQRVFVNEIYNSSNSQGDDEFFEYVVADSVINLEGWMTCDNNSTTDVWQGKYVFTGNSQWQNVRKGTIILLHGPNFRGINSNKPAGLLVADKTQGALLDNPSGSGSTFNLSGSGDFVQIVDNYGNHEHGIGYDANPGPSVCSTGANNCKPIKIPNPNRNVWAVTATINDAAPNANFSFVKSALTSETSYHLNDYTIAGGYNQGYLTTANAAIEMSSANSPGLATLGKNKEWLIKLRTPAIDSQAVCLEIKNNGFSFLMHGATDATFNDTYTNYLVVRSTAVNPVWTAPTNGQEYAPGNSLGANTVVTLQAHRGDHNTVQDFFDAGIGIPAGTTPTYRVYASRFRGQNITNPENGIVYNSGKYVTVGRGSLPTITLESPAPICAPDTQEIMVNAIDLGPDFQFTFPDSVRIISSRTKDGNTYFKLHIGARAHSDSIKIKKAGSCADSIKYPIVILARPDSGKLMGPDYFCSGSDAIFSVDPAAADSGVTYSWLVSGGTLIPVSDTSRRLEVSGTSNSATITVRKSRGSCIAEVRKTVTYLESQLPPRIAGPNLACAGETLAYSINVTPDPRYTYYFTAANGAYIVSDSTADTVRVAFDGTANQSSVITINQIYRQACTSSSVRAVTVGISPRLAVADTFTVNCDSTLYAGVTDTSGYTFQWIPATGLSNAFIVNPKILVTSNTDYTLRVTAKTPEKCHSDYPVHVYYKTCDAISFGNVITPETVDGYNDALKLVHLQPGDRADIEIFNRWGKRIYQSGYYLNDWTGKDYPAGAYYYILNYQHRDPVSNITSVTHKTGSFQVVK